MPKKSAAVDFESPESLRLLELFQGVGISLARSKDVIQASKTSVAFQRLLAENPIETKLEEKQAGLLVEAAKEGFEASGKYGAGEDGKGGSRLSSEDVTYLVKAIEDGRLKSVDQVKGAATFLESRDHAATVDSAAFDKASGVGITFTPETIVDTLTSFISSLSLSSPSTAPADWSSLKAFRTDLFSGAPDLRWANGKELATGLDTVFTTMFGPRVSAAPAKKAAPAKAAAAKPAEAGKIEMADPSSIFNEGFLSRLHAPGGNPQINEENKRKHLEFTKGKVMTRFPPEPNGFLHIGHVKAITIDFGYAKHHGGCCYLRFDDTNPSGEEGVYFDSILETVRWLGFEPWKITYASDNFGKLYELATELTRRGKAYVCHCDQEAIAASRGGGRGAPTACIHRDRPVEENLREFQAMRDGKYPEKAAALRMKIDLTSGNPFLWDPVCYRVKDAPHHRTGSEWKIYPAYDFAHPLCDSIENISHSLCTLEFVDARASYEWLCDALEVYKPRQYETARLSLQGTFLSKRKIKKLVDKKYVKGWDDPRLFTLIALRRRGIPPAAMLRFVADIGVSTTISETKLIKFEQVIRSTLEMSAPRLHLVLEPIKLTITNVPDDWKVDIEKPLHPKIPEMGSLKATMRKTSFIDADDFRITPPADYNRLSPGKSVILMGAPHPVTCTEYKTDAEGKVTELTCALEDGTGPNGTKKLKASAIHWVSCEDGVKVDEVRFFESLFNSDEPGKLDDFEADIRADSLKVVTSAVIEPAFFELSKKLISEAKKDAAIRTAEAAKFSQGNVDTAEAAPLTMGSHDETVEGMATSVPHSADHTPVATAAQLVGMECIRFQGMRLAYFAVDKEAVIGCLNDTEGVEAGMKPGDKIILNKIVSLKEEKGKKGV